ncbi:MAG: hypothetical protein NC341_11715 [Blautia sp.]|nr:hypothetical protein [Blautia sp.]MCM1202232.1 hypothetical protein [Bacteroides fragilis]
MQWDTHERDSTHDKEHIYRVLYTAMDIARTEQNVEYAARGSYGLWRRKKVLHEMLGNTERE